MKYNYRVKFKDVITDKTEYTSKYRFTNGYPKFATESEAIEYIDMLNSKTDSSGKTHQEIYLEHGQELVAVKIERRKRTPKVEDPSFSNPFKVGDILCGDSGFTMVLPVWFEIIKVTPTRVKLKKLVSYVSSGNYMQGKSMPSLGVYEKEGNYNPNGIVEKMFAESNTYCVRNDRTILTLWNEEPMTHDHMD